MKIEITEKYKLKSTVLYNDVIAIQEREVLSEKYCDIFFSCGHKISLNIDYDDLMKQIDEQTLKNNFKELDYD